jgi:hypothetical protein
MVGRGRGGQRGEWSASTGADDEVDGHQAASRAEGAGRQAVSRAAGAGAKPCPVNRGSRRARPCGAAVTGGDWAQ